MKLTKQTWKQIFQSYWWLAIVVVIIDQASKWAAALTDANVTIIPNFFHFRYIRNTGAAFGIFGGSALTLGLVSFIVGGLLIFYRIYKRKQMKPLTKIVFATIIGGTYGNFIDRAFYPEGVIDFISFQFGSYHFAVFNIADIALVLGLITLIILIIFNNELLPALNEEKEGKDEKVKEEVKAEDGKEVTETTEEENIDEPHL